MVRNVGDTAERLGARVGAAVVRTGNGEPGVTIARDSTCFSGPRWEST